MEEAGPASRKPLLVFEHIQVRWSYARGRYKLLDTFANIAASHVQHFNHYHAANCSVSLDRSFSDEVNELSRMIVSELL